MAPRPRRLSGRRRRLRVGPLGVEAMVLGRLESWSMTTLPLSEVKARLSEIAEEVERTHERVHVTRDGRERRAAVG